MYYGPANLEEKGCKTISARGLVRGQAFDGSKNFFGRELGFLVSSAGNLHGLKVQPVTARFCLVKELTKEALDGIFLVLLVRVADVLHHDLADEAFTSPSRCLSVKEACACVTLSQPLNPRSLAPHGSLNCCCAQPVDI
jgi:hypothetical protein